MGSDVRPRSTQPGIRSVRVNAPTCALYCFPALSHMGCFITTHRLLALTVLKAGSPGSAKNRVSRSSAYEKEPYE